MPGIIEVVVVFAQGVVQAVHVEAALQSQRQSSPKINTSSYMLLLL